MDEVNDWVQGYYQPIGDIRYCAAEFYKGKLKLLAGRLLIDFGDRT